MWLGKHFNLDSPASRIMCWNYRFMEHKVDLLNRNWAFWFYNEMENHTLCTTWWESNFSEKINDKKFNVTVSHYWTLIRHKYIAQNWKLPWTMVRRSCDKVFWQHRTAKQENFVPFVPTKQIKPLKWVSSQKDSSGIFDSPSCNILK